MQTIRERMAGDTKAARAFGRVSKFQSNGIVAHATLDGDLGYFSDSNNHDYGLDKPTRDRLIAHARQDAAHALCNTKSIMDGLGWVKLLTVLNTVLLVVLLVRGW